jgi:hypothetical protein
VIYQFLSDPNQKTPYPPVYPSMPMPGQPQAQPNYHPMQQPPYSQQGVYPPHHQQQGMPPPSYDFQQQPVITQQPSEIQIFS